MTINHLLIHFAITNIFTSFSSKKTNKHVIKIRSLWSSTFDNIFFYVAASGGLYSSIYITVQLIIFAYWTQLLKHRTHGTNNFLVSMFMWFLLEMWTYNTHLGRT